MVFVIIVIEVVCGVVFIVWFGVGVSCSIFSMFFIVSVLVVLM